MKKTVLFGAGTQAALIYQNEQADREFIAVLDNNVQSQGGFFFSLPVVSPNDLCSLDYDEVVITTQRVEEVRQQLIETLQVAPDKIATPQRQLSKELQSFRHKPTAELATKLLNEISNSKEIAQLDVITDLNTLLFLQQQQGLNITESVLNFSLPYQQLDSLAEILPSFLTKVGPAIQYTIESMQKSEQAVIALIVEIEPVIADGRRFSLCFRGRHLHEDIWVDLPSRGLFYVPAELCQRVVLKSFGSVVARVPECTEDYLNFIYDNWRTAVVSTSQVNYAHRGLLRAFTLPPVWPEELALMFSQQEDVSVLTAVYNHEETLAESLDSALSQISPFKIQIYCFDDASTDRSADILRQYQSVFADRITVYTTPENQGIGKKSILFHRPDIRGRYWGFLAGDDFWLDVQKLYRQTVYLDSQPQAVGCCCDTVLFEQHTKKESLIAADLECWNIFDLLLYKRTVKMYTHTSSILWRNIWRESRGFFLPAEFEKSYAFGDSMLSHMMLACGGEMHRIRRTMSCYRYTRIGVWSSLTKEQQRIAQQKVLKGVRRAMPLSLKLLQWLQPLKRSSLPLTAFLPGPLNER